MGELGGNRCREARLVRLFMTDMAVEIAIWTFREAKRPVHIYAQTRRDIAAFDSPSAGDGISQDIAPRV